MALDSSGFTAWRETTRPMLPAVQRPVLPIGIPVRRRRRGGQHPQLDQPHRRANRVETSPQCCQMNRSAGHLLPVDLAMRRGRLRGQHPHLDRSDRRRERVDEDHGRSGDLTLRRLVPVGLAVRGRRWRAPASTAKPQSSPRPIRPAARAPGAARQSPPVAESSMRCRARRSRCASPATPAADVLTSTNPTGGASAWNENHGRSRGSLYRHLVPVGLAVRSRRRQRQRPHHDQPDRRRKRMEKTTLSGTRFYGRLMPVGLAVRRRRPAAHPHLD